jgi:phage/plasmid-like protein (TIGR03299 family)|tara:strand:+ start:769 stop:1797 length:1029 start_codon:yes stop_codon:yes gene_type:complete
MSHEIENANMAWISEKPWHGLGTEMEPGMPALKWMKTAGLDWEVVRQPMFTQLPNGENVVVSGKRDSEYGVLIRDHGNGKFDPVDDVFGPVGPEWVPVQNKEVFEFVDKFCKAGSMTMETCGSLKGGTEIWVLARFADDFDIVKGDQMKGYLLYHSAHVWGKGNQVRLTPIRVVCNNTLTMAIGASGKKKGTAFRMPHVRAFDADVQRAAEQALGLAGDQLATFKEMAQHLSKKKATADDIMEFVARVYQPKKELAANEQLVDNLTPSSESVLEAIQMAPGADLKGSRGTWWGAFNGVTYFEDHMRISYQDSTNILASTWFGGGARRKELALEYAMEYAEVA